MRRRLISGITVVVSCLAAPICYAQDVTLSILPNEQQAEIGSPVQADIVISGLGDGSAPSVGAFDFDVFFDGDILSVQDGVQFGLGLNVGESGTQNGFTSGSGTLNLFEFSFASAVDLDALQPSQFTLASLSFDTLGTGMTTLGLGPDTIIIGDAGGVALSAALQDAMVTVVPQAEVGGSISGGGARSGNVAEELGPLTVTISNAENQPLAGIAVTWAIASGAAMLGSATSVTDENGQASNTVTLLQSGTANVTADATGIDGTAIFTLTTSGLTENEETVVTAAQGACAAIESIPAADRTSGQADLLTTCNDDLGSSAGTLAPDEVSAQGTSAIETAAMQTTNIVKHLTNDVRSGSAGGGLNISGLTLRYDDQVVPGRVLQEMLSTPRGGAAGDQESDLIFGRLSLFITGDVDFGDKDGTDRETGFDFNTGGVTAGLDYRVTDEMVVGTAFGLASQDSDFDSSNGGLDTVARSVSVFGTYYHSNNIYVDGLVSFGWNDYDITRRLSAGQSAVGDTDGDEFSFSLGAGYEFRRDAFTFGPFVRFNYTDVDIDGYTELPSNPGAPGAGSVLALDSQKVKSATSVLGGQISYAISAREAVITPQLRFEWEHEFEDDSRDIDARFVNDPTGVRFTTSSDAPDRDFFNLGAGISATLAEGRSAFVFYETQLGQRDIELHSVTAGVRLAF